ncbi:MAG: UDP-4-amino-4,6-dideoxy-N-acetyl-beta-L-altrosamine transaminase, partial [bacterium (Candidatus Ratteibacteria) CG01_land_8_20_14_3_00_40_19]
RQENIGVQVHYIPVYYQPYYQKFGYKKGLCPKAEEYYKEAISLPLFPRMTDKEIDRVVRVVRKNVYS